jgi:hypothetical protein
MCGYVCSQQNGGNGGVAFADNLTEFCQLVQVNLRAGSEVDAIQGVWSTPAGTRVTGTMHGGGGGTPASFDLDQDEFIVRVDGRSGSRVDQLTFTTNKGRTHGPYGGKGGDKDFHLSDLKVGGFCGRSGSGLDAIGFYTPGTCP